jgi:hypothetical protein
MLLAAIAAVGLSAGARLSSAESIVVEPIHVLVAQNQPVELFFPNEYDLIHTKKVTFEGTLTNPTEVDGVMAMYFDWIDPLQPGVIFNTQVVEFPVHALSTAPILATDTIPFCPPEVSLHFRLGDAPVMQVDGTFTHECVPEPASLLTAAMGAVGLAFAGWRRARSSKS